MDEFQLRSLMEHAAELAGEGKLLHAEQVYSKIIEAEPDFAEAYCELSSIYIGLGKHQVAERLLQDALARDKDNIEVVFLLGNLYLRSEQYDRAIEMYQVLENKGFPQVHFNLGLTYFYKNDIEKAEQHLRLVLKYDPEFPQINESLGEVLLKKKAYGEATIFLERSVKLDSSSWINHYLLGVAYADTYQWKEAYDQFVLAMEIDPNEPFGWQKCGEVLIQLQRLEEAEQHLKKAIELNPAFADAFAHLGTLSMRREDWDKAASYFDKALDVEPGNVQAIEGKIRVRVFGRRKS
jgi:tetratricopeptide (TPR) repeat protein